MTAGRAHAGGEPRFVGRNAEMAAALDAAARRPGLLVVAGATWVGTTRFATELAQALADDGIATIRVRSGSSLAERLSMALSAAELRFDPVKAAQLAPFAALVGDIDEAGVEEALAIGRALEGNGGLLIGCAAVAPDGAAAVTLEPLDDEHARAIVTESAPDVDAASLERIVEIGAGRPGVLVPLIRANRDPVSDEHPVRVPLSQVETANAPLAGHAPPEVDVLRWAALLDPTFVAAQLVRVTARNEQAVSDVLTTLIGAGILIRETDPDRVRFADPLLPIALRQTTPPAELRRRYAAVLGARRAAHDPPAALVPSAIGTGNAAEVVAVSLAASAESRQDGDADGALTHAERAVSWSTGDRPDAERLDALLQHGLALGVTGNWEHAATVLNDVIRRQRRGGNEGAAIWAISEWARVRWYAGYHAEALEMIEEIARRGDTALPERARALHQAAMFAAHGGHHDDAERWARAAREEAVASGEHAVAVQATNTLGLAQVFSTASPEGLAHFRTGFEDAERAHLGRHMAVTLNNWAVSLLMLGMVRQAADRAQQGLDLAAARGIGEVDAPLSQNLAEALAAMGRFREARAALVRARDSWIAMGSRSLESLDMLAAWIDFCEGKVPEALATLRVLADETRTSAPLEETGQLFGTYAHVAHAAGEVDEARGAVTSGLQHRQGTHDRLDTLMLTAAAAILLPSDDAAPFADELAESARTGAPLAVALVPLTRAWTAAAAVARVAEFREASARFDEAGFHWWSARALMLAGQCGDGRQAVDDLLEARRRFRDHDSPGWRALCEAELRARGHRFVMPSRRRDENALSEREIEVVNQLARGLSNREIAERLHITPKTANRHLERIYAKLGVSSRTAAVSSAVERGLIADIETTVRATGRAPAARPPARRP